MRLHTNPMRCAMMCETTSSSITHRDARDDTTSHIINGNAQEEALPCLLSLITHNMKKAKRVRIKKQRLQVTDLT